MADASAGGDRREVVEAIGRKVQGALMGGPENADLLDAEQLRLLNAAGFFTRAQIEHFADRIREADRILEEVLSTPTLRPDGPGVST